MTSSSRTLLEVRIWMQYTVRRTEANVFIFRVRKNGVTHACTLMLKFVVCSCLTYMKSSATEIQISGFGGSVINWPPESDSGSDSGSRSFRFYQRFKKFPKKVQFAVFTAIYLWPFSKPNVLNPRKCR
jgi:hypothetical protein